MTAPVAREHPARSAATSARKISALARRPAPPGSSGEGVAEYPIEVFEVDRAPFVGDRAFEFQVPFLLNACTLTDVELYLNTAGSGTTQVQLANHHYAGGVDDMLSTKLSIDSGEIRSRDATVQRVIDTAHDDVLWGDMISIDVDAIATGSLGMGCILTFTPTALINIAISGATGPAGGVTNWRGEWDNVSTYVTADAVSHNGTSYVARTSVPAGIEPGVTVGWQTYWQVLSGGKSSSSIELVINGNGRVIDIGPKAPVFVPFDCTIVEAVLLADQAGSIQVDAWRIPFASYPPLDAQSITGSSPMVITSNDQSSDTTLSGWSTSLNARDCLIFNVDSCSTITFCGCALLVQR